MIIERIDDFLPYFERVRERTLRVARATPADRLEWKPGEDRFSVADLVRHIAATERWMWAENVSGRPSRYDGFGPELMRAGEDVWACADRHHAEAVKIFRALTPEDLRRKCPTVGGIELATWKWLRAMIEHEIHHRGQIYSLLGTMSLPAPPLYGLTEREVWERSRPQGD
jgi:uncharacterized damage-inducible protein DinB